MNKVFNTKYLIILFLCISIFIVYIISSKYIDAKFNDIVIKTSKYLLNKQAGDEVVLVAVDNKSLEKISWPWTKDLYSNIFNYLEHDSGAKAIINHDLISSQDSYNPDKDRIFFNNLTKEKKLINSYIFLNSLKSGDILPSSYINMFDSKNKIIIEDRRKNKYNKSYKGVMSIPKDVIENANNLAFSMLIEDSDTINRSYMPAAEFNGKLYPSIALSAYSLYTGIKSFTLYDNYLCSNDNCKILKIPVKHLKKHDYLTNDVWGIYTLINWYKPKGEFYTHKVYSAIDVLDSYYALREGKTPILNPELFKNKIVIVGLNADGYVWERLSQTPVLTKQADIDIHACMISNMLKNNFVTTDNSKAVLIITIIFSLFIIRGYRKLKYNLILALVLSVVYLVYYLYEYFVNVYIPPISPIVVLFSCAISKKIYEVLTSDKKIEMMKKAMGKYISKDVMQKVISDLDKLHVGGTKVIATVLFVDIRNFTSISEKLSPQEVTLILNEYFAKIEPIVAKYHGIINKYIGDGVLAVFGEPIRSESHALNAVKCAVEIIEEVKKLKEKFLAENKPPIEIGIGINTGEVFAGNIGTDERLEYTVIGDNVNLAYRIETYNQLLRTQFLISSHTYEYIKDKIDVVKLSEVYIKGKSMPIDIYEVLKLRDE